MKCGKPLSDFYQEYTLGKLPRKDLEGKMFLYLRDNQNRFRIFDRNSDRWNEYVSWLYPRFAKAVDLYRDMGLSFDTYIVGLVHGAAKEYKSRETEHYMTEYMCWQAKAEEMALAESERQYSIKDDEPFPLPKDINRKQVLFLLLKSYFFVSDEYVKKVAQTIGMNVEKIQGMVDKLRNKRAGREEEIRALRERLQCQHYRCLAYQKLLLEIPDGTGCRENLNRRFQRARKRFTAMRKRLGGMRFTASNRMIAEVTGIPRGTVDSGLFAIRNRLARYDL